MLLIEKGNLVTMAENGMFDVIIHGCNCFCTMNSGIAREIRERYPESYDVDSQTTPGDVEKLGNYTIAKCVGPTGHNFMIVNAYTQYVYNRKGESADLFEYSSFDLILRKLTAKYGHSRFGLPYIGMGLAGGDKGRIIPMIEKFANNVVKYGNGSVTLVEYSS